MKLEDRKAELINELDKAIKAPKTRILEYHNRVKNIKEKIKRIEKKSLHIDDKPILRVDIFMTDEYLNSICYNEDHLKEYVKAMRFHPVKVKIVRVLWFLKNGKAEFRKFLKIDNDKENNPIIKTIVEYHRRKIVRKQLIRQGNFKWVMICLVYNYFVVLFY